MIVTKQNLIDRKINYNLDRFLNSRISVEYFFKYFYENPPPLRNVFDFPWFCETELPKVNRTFV
jgi:hypothetical protein